MAQTLESDGTPKAIAVVEFPSMARAREWHASPDHAEALELRDAALSRRLILVEGVVPTA